MDHHPEVDIVDPGERLNGYIRACYYIFEGLPTLCIIDKCLATKDLTKKKDMLSDLVFNGRHSHFGLGCQSLN